MIKRIAKNYIIYPEKKDICYLEYVLKNDTKLTFVTFGMPATRNRFTFDTIFLIKGNRLRKIKHFETQMVIPHLHPITKKVSLKVPKILLKFEYDKDN